MADGDCSNGRNTDYLGSVAPVDRDCPAATPLDVVKARGEGHSVGVSANDRRRRQPKGQTAREASGEASGGRGVAAVHRRTPE
ncbi:hypothetical protein NDU88_010476 [Pleurodeles waltl]|uniref:Uncharacterized protein n=1 Tax=Pleurodeles waltl TaxID=8319 RepID=A0AAV7PW56_PLEWA|nr:hypothetical protein NDU88_010476 [Pleurodeles waltl]